MLLRKERVKKPEHRKRSFEFLICFFSMIWVRWNEVMSNERVLIQDQKWKNLEKTKRRGKKGKKGNICRRVSTVIKKTSKNLIHHPTLRLKTNIKPHLFQLTYLPNCVFSSLMHVGPLSFNHDYIHRYIFSNHEMYKYDCRDCRCEASTNIYR